MDQRPIARVGETALSPERKSEWTRHHQKEGARGGTMGSPTLEVTALLKAEPKVAERPRA